MVERRRLRRVIGEVLKRFPVESPWAEGLGPFHTLVSVILSQKTNRENVRKAIVKFMKAFPTVSDIASADLEEVMDAIKPAGLWRMKAPRIKLLAEQLAAKEIELSKVMKLPYPEAMKILTSMKGIGPKTADVFLMIARNEPVFPVDTHISRVVKRLGLVDKRADYVDIKAALEKATPPELRMKAHLALIEFGRKICRSRSPKCGECPFSENCPSSGIKTY